jgi:hypothetical protein
MSSASPRERALRASAVIHPLGEILDGLPDLYPERKIWRTGPPYTYRHRSESLGYAAGAYASAYWRLTRREITHFNAGWLSDRLHSPDPWDVLVPYLAAEGIPFSEPDEDGNERRLVPEALYLTSSADEIVRACIHRGPVLAFLPWPHWWDSMSDAWGVQWVGPAGPSTPRITELQPRISFRGAVVKGVSYRYHAVRIRDGFDDHPDLWLSLRALKDAMSYGGRALMIGA